MLLNAANACCLSTFQMFGTKNTNQRRKKNAEPSRARACGLLRVWLRAIILLLLHILEGPARITARCEVASGSERSEEPQESFECLVWKRI